MKSNIQELQRRTKGKVEKSTYSGWFNVFTTHVISSLKSAILLAFFSGIPMPERCCFDDEIEEFKNGIDGRSSELKCLFISISFNVFTT